MVQFVNLMVESGDLISNHSDWNQVLIGQIVFEHRQFPLQLSECPLALQITPVNGRRVPFLNSQNELQLTNNVCGAIRQLLHSFRQNIHFLYRVGLILLNVCLEPLTYRTRWPLRRQWAGILY